MSSPCPFEVDQIGLSVILHNEVVKVIKCSTFKNPDKLQYLVMYLCESTSGQSYNHFMIVNYDSSVIIWGIFKSGTTLEA